MRGYLIQYRKDKNMTQQNVIEKMNVSQVYYSLIESGQRQSDMDLSIMQKLAKAFDVDISAIVSAETKYQKERQEGKT